MEIKEPRLRALLAQAGRNAESGKNAAAELMYRDILSQAPEAEEAWIGLARVTRDADEKRAAYERALELSPENPAAVAGLAELDGRPVPPDVAAALAPDEEEVVLTPPAWPEEAEPPDAPVEADVDYTLTCYRHPQRMTALRCYNCNRPICIQCANKTPVGYICPECRREAEDAFFNARPLDYVIAIAVALPISLLAGFLLLLLSSGFFFFILLFFISGAVGSFIGRLTKRAIGGRRGRYLPALVVAMMAVGVAIPFLPVVLLIFGGSTGALLSLLGPGIFLAVGGGAAYWQVR